MKKLLVVIFLLLISCYVRAQQKDSIQFFLGTGWIVGVSTDIVFVPCNSSTKLPSVDDFFKEKNKYGLRLNNVDGAAIANSYCFERKIITPKEGASTICITPVVATYKLAHVDDESKGVYESGRTYKYKNISDTVKYTVNLHYSDVKIKPIIKSR